MTSNLRKGIVGFFGLYNQKTRHYFLLIFSLILFVSLWWAISVLFNKPRVFPSPILVGEKLLSLVQGESEVGPSSYSHLWSTLSRLFIASTLAFSIGSTVGILMGRILRIFNFFENLAWIFICVPAIVWSYILVVTFGTTDITAIGVVMALVTPKVALNVSEGSKAIPQDLIEMADSFRATLFQKIKDIYLPYLIPYLFGGARIGFSIGLKVIIVAELVGLGNGIGYMIDYWWDEFFLAPILAWALFLILTGLAIEYGFFGILERKLKKWQS